jgi:sterol desaturase/sphingolipid hydroxylase (fatty acid hydroxylase superfamily)
LKLPLAYKLLLFYIVEDFGLYWVHRLMHTKRLWRTHKWHHYPNYMYWLAGIRTSDSAYRTLQSHLYCGETGARRRSSMALPAHIDRAHPANLGSLLTIWDKVFGTYFDPSKVKQNLRFGIGERIAPWRLVLGV